MRKLNTSDVFKFARIITKSGIKDEFKAVYANYKDMGSEAVEGAGYDALFRILAVSTTPEMEKELVCFLCDVAERERVETLDLDDMMDIIDEIEKDNGLSRFFDTLAKLIR